MEYNHFITFIERYGYISEEDKKNLKVFSTLKKVKKKEILIEKGTPCNKIFFVKKGLLRAYYTDGNGREITRMFAWQNRFLTNICSFSNFEASNETIECIKDAEILSINKMDFDRLIKSSENFNKIYSVILEKCAALHLKRFEVLSSFDIQQKMLYLKNEYPFLRKELSDTLLASFLGISREYYVKHKHLL
ncbi:MAG: Crp/Fnr family transcriptional regulator [Cruoricaptor ignavus]|nr:Crp/Fnr family transcriptional regulator [Cruoricaptor ignavus]